MRYLASVCRLNSGKRIIQGVGIALDPVTSGPVVDETMATSVEGIYACGNVVHVHDLVDYVTRESETAGYHAAEFIKNNNGASGSEVHRTIPGKGVRYIVPQRISNNSLLKGFKIFFRSDKVYVNARIAVRCGRQVLHSVKRQKISPGEMEILDLKPSHLENIEVSSLAENGLTIELEY